MSAMASAVALPAPRSSSSAVKKAVAALCATAALSAGAQLVAPPPAEALSWQWRWFGGQALLNRSETLKVSYGSAGAAAVAMWIPEPTLSKIAASAFGLYAAYAGYTYSIGRCVNFNITWWGGVYPGSYYDWRCR